MALKPCRECGEEVPKYAKICPHCEIRNPVTTQRERLEHKLSMIFYVILFAGLAVLVIFIYRWEGFTVRSMDTGPKATQDSPSSSSPTQTTEASRLPEYRMIRTEDSSYGRVIRQAVRIRVPKHYTKGEVERIAHAVADSIGNLRRLNALMMYFYGPDSPIPGFPDVARVEWAPYGDWSKAHEVQSGDYSSFKYSFHYTPPVGETTSTPVIPPHQEGQIRNYSIRFTAEHVGLRTFRISGTSNLPEGAYLSINIYDEDYFEHDDDPDMWRFENLTFIPRSVSVKDGKIELYVAATAIEARLKSGRYFVEVSFNPRSIHNPQTVKEIVGRNGEYLGGEHLNKEIDGLTMLEVKQLISLKPMR